MQTPMRVIPTGIAALIALIALSGCPSPYKSDDPAPMSDPDGVSCDDSMGASAVRIDVVYTGTEVGTPDEICEVDPGTQITWRGPEGGRETFKLRFHEASPGGRGAPLQVASSRSDDGRQKVSITADNESGRYMYDILIPGGGVDPAIIIR